MSLAAIFNVPTTPEDLATWATSHAAHHRDIIRRIYEVGGVSLPEYVLEPINPDNMTLWAYQHQIMHQQMDALLGIEGYNLTNANFKDLTALTNWIQLNANEHYQADDLLSLGTGSGPPVPPAVVTTVFEDNAQSSAGGASYSFPGISFGTPNAGRYIVIGITWRGPLALGLSSVNIGGVAASLLVASTIFTGAGAALVMALVPTGATGTVTVNFTNTTPNCTIAVYSLTGVSALGAAVVASRTATITTNLSAALDVAQDGAVIAVASNFAFAFPPAHTWLNLTEDCENTYLGGSGFTTRSSASRNFAAQQFGVLCRVNFSASDGSAAVFAVFNP